MGFNSKKFGSAKFIPRTAEVKVPALKDWFDKDEEPVFKVRGMTASELAKANEANDNSERIKAVVEALTTQNKSKQKTAFQDIFGFGEDTPKEIQKRIVMLTTCSVEPELDQMTVVKLAEVVPIEFYIMTNKITELTGQGSFVEGKSPPSGKTRVSGSPANSPSVEGASSSK
jgi:hypothetical protein